MSIIELVDDFSTMEEFEPLPAGVYPMELQEARHHITDKVPEGMIYCQFRISPDHFPADYDVGNAPEGLALIFCNVRFPTREDRRSVARFRKFFEAFGISKEEIKNSVDLDALIGKQVQGLLKVEEYQGAMQNSIVSVSPMPQV